MNSSDYKNRFIAEYYQLKYRLDKLHETIIKHEAGTLTFEPTCPMGILIKQEVSMKEYLRCLEIRAEIDHIDLH